jgi:hypothetical protein
VSAYTYSSLATLSEVYMITIREAKEAVYVIYTGLKKLSCEEVADYSTLKVLQNKFTNM